MISIGYIQRIGPQMSLRKDSDISNLLISQDIVI